MGLKGGVSGRKGVRKRVEWKSEWVSGRVEQVPNVTRVHTLTVLSSKYIVFDKKSIPMVAWKIDTILAAWYGDTQNQVEP